MDLVEPHDEAVLEMIGRIRSQPLAAEILIGLKKLALPGVDLGEAKKLARHGTAAVENHSLGYVVITAVNAKTTAHQSAPDPIFPSARPGNW